MKTSSKIITVVLLTPPLVLAYMGTFGMQIGSRQLTCALMLLLFWFLYIINQFTNLLEQN